MTTRALIAIREPSLDTDEGPRLLPLNTGRFPIAPSLSAIRKVSVRVLRSSLVAQCSAKRYQECRRTGRIEGRSRLHKRSFLQ